MMMQEQTPTVDVTSSVLQKPAHLEIQHNSQGERIEVSNQQDPLLADVGHHQQEAAPLECSYLDISLWDTPLAGPLDALHPPTDDSGLEHAIISCGHVLKSTHDLARWSEKTGARRVNGLDSIDSISDIIIGMDPNVASDAPAPQGKTGGSKRSNKRNQKSVQQPSQVISCGPVLKSTHDAATAIEKRNLNSAGAAGLLDEVANIAQGQQRLKHLRQGQRRNGGRQPRVSQQPSQIINSWPVLKSTHDLATRAEKSGIINNPVSVSALDDLIAQTGIQAGGSSLQSGLDTQGGSHVQLEGEKKKETPEKAMQALHLHV